MNYEKQLQTITDMALHAIWKVINHNLAMGKDIPKNLRHKAYLEDELERRGYKLDSSLEFWYKIE